jgi:AcrR family transcriptional regulator
LRAAELVFARHGYAAASIRQITEAAGANVAAVNYHFGSKERLLAELLDQIVKPITERRLALLDDVQRNGTPGLRELVAAFIRPDLEVIAELRARDRDLPRFVARMYTDGTDLMGEIMGAQFAENQRRFVAALSAALPGVDPNEILFRLRCVVGILVYLFSGVDGGIAPPMLSGDLESDLERLVSVAESIMSGRVGEVVG